MSIEVGKIDTIQDGIPNNEKGNEFTNSEKNLIKDFYKSNKYKDVDESTLEEVKKTWGDGKWSHFFEQNYKKIAKNASNFPTLYPLLQDYLEKNKVSVQKYLEKKLLIKSNISTSITPEETGLMREQLVGDKMQDWLKDNPEKSGFDASNYFNRIMGNTINEWVQNKDREKFNKYPNILLSVIEELYYTAKRDINENTITPDTEYELNIINTLLSNKSLMSIYDNKTATTDKLKDFHNTVKEYLLTIKNEKILTGIDWNGDMSKNKEIEKMLENFINIGQQKTSDISILQEATYTIQPVLKRIYDLGLEEYNKAKEESDPLKQIMFYNKAKKLFESFTSTRKKSGVNFSKVLGGISGEEIETGYTLSQDMIQEINNFLKGSNIAPKLYNIACEEYGKALIESDEDSKKEKYETCKEYFEMILEKKKDDERNAKESKQIVSVNKNLLEIYDDSEIKLKNINTYLSGGEQDNVTIERVDISSLPVLSGPNPCVPGNGDQFHIYVGENKQEFDTIEVFSMLGQKVEHKEIGKDIFPLPDTTSDLQYEQNPVQFELPLNGLAAGIYILKLSSKRQQIEKTITIEVL